MVLSLLLQVFPDDPEGIKRLGYFFLAWFGLSVFLSLALPKWEPHFYIGSCLDWRAGSLATLVPTVSVRGLRDCAARAFCPLCSKMTWKELVVARCESVTNVIDFGMLMYCWTPDSVCWVVAHKERHKRVALGVNHHYILWRSRTQVAAHQKMIKWHVLARQPIHVLSGLHRHKEFGRMCNKVDVIGEKRMLGWNLKSFQLIIVLGWESIETSQEKNIVHRSVSAFVKWQDGIKIAFQCARIYMHFFFRHETSSLLSYHYKFSWYRSYP